MKRTTLIASWLLVFTLTTQAADEKKVGRRVHYTGKVQGVGFRATAVEIAKDFKVTGWVKNLADGRVELRVEGTEPEVKRFLDAIRTKWPKNIEKVQIEANDVTGKWKDFSVMY